MKKHLSNPLQPIKAWQGWRLREQMSSSNFQGWSRPYCLHFFWSYLGQEFNLEYPTSVAERNVSSVGSMAGCMPYQGLCMPVSIRVVCLRGLSTKAVTC